MMGDDYDNIQWLSDPSLKPSLAALEEKAAELNAAEPMRLLRIERDRRLAEVDWMVIKAYSQNAQISLELAAYMQALRDLPNTATPTLDSRYDLDMSSVVWPTKP
jgi:hypothetical protein